MFRFARYFFSKPTAARHRPSQAALQVTTFGLATSKHNSVRALDPRSRFAAMRLAFNTDHLSELLDKSLPSTANLLTIDNTTKGGFNDIPSILECVILNNHQYIHAREGPWVRYPLVVIVRTALEKDDADAAEFVLVSALQQRDHFKDATAIVLDARLSSLVGSFLSSKNGSATVVKVEEIAVASAAASTATNAAASNAADSTAKNDPPVEKKVKKGEIKAKEGGGKAKEGTKAKEGGGKAKEGGVKAKEGTKAREGTKAKEEGVKAKEEGAKAKEEGAKAKEEGVKAKEGGGKAKEGGVKAKEEGVKAKEGTKAKEEGQKQPPVTKKAPKSNGVKKATPAHGKKELHSEGNARVGAAEGADASAPSSLSHPPPPGTVKKWPPCGAGTQAAARESLRRVFHSSLAGPFQSPQQVERKLFLGYVDKVRLADMLNIPLYGDGEVYVLYYRLTGAGSCRTPLITISHILEEVCRQKTRAAEKGNAEVVFSDRMPMLVLLSASFLIGEDANLLCQEYQRALETRLSMLADVNVVIAPTFYTEKNILFALRAAGISMDSIGSAKQQQQEEDVVSPKSNLPPRGDHAAASASASASASAAAAPLSEDALRSLVTNALEEVALRHEKSTDHLVSTLNKLVQYWSRERVIELIEGLQSEREVLLDATKEFDNVQRQLRSAQDALKALQYDVQGIDEKVGNLKSAAETPSVDISALTESIAGLERRLVKSVDLMPSKQQISLDMREELENMQQNLQRDFDQSMGKKLERLHEEQRRDLKQAFDHYIPTDGKVQQEPLAQQTLQELPQRIQTAMENALQSLNQGSDEKTAKILIEQQQLVATQVSALRDAVCKAVEEGQRRVEHTVTELLHTIPKSSSAYIVQGNAGAKEKVMVVEKEKEVEESVKTT